MPRTVLISGKYGMYVRDAEKLLEALVSLQLLAVLEKQRPSCLKCGCSFFLALIQNGKRENRRMRRLARESGAWLVTFDAGEGRILAASSSEAVFKAAGAREEVNPADASAILKRQRRRDG